jgi:Protein of unknown function (DUF669)
MLDEAFDVDNEEGTKPPELLPIGTYTAEIEDAYVTTTKNGAGQMVCFKWRIIEGEYENRVVFDQILIQHTSADAQKFGRQKFKDVCAACEVTGQVTDLEVLKFRKASIRVAVARDKTGEYGDKNRIARVQRYGTTLNDGKPAAKALPKAGVVEAELDDKVDF